VETLAKKELYNKVSNVKLLDFDKEKMVMIGEII
jgi:hypothetical protein